VFLNRTADCPAPALTPVAPFEAMRRAHGQSFRFNPADPVLNARFLDALGRMLSLAPAFQLDYPSDFSAIAPISDLLKSRLEAVAA